MVLLVKPIEINQFDDRRGFAGAPAEVVLLVKAMKNNQFHDRPGFAGAPPDLRRKSFSLALLIKPIENHQFDDRRASPELRRSCAGASPEFDPPKI